MKHILVASFVLFSLISSQSKSEEYAVWGWGAASCAFMLKNAQRNNGSLDSTNHEILTGWVQGYISAMNVKSRKTIDSKTDTDGIIFELIKRCKAEPMSFIVHELDWIYENKLVLSR